MLRRFVVIVWTLLVLTAPYACAQEAGPARSPYLDAAFTMLEKDNIFLRRYNERTGAGAEAWFELGVPYFFGGQDVRHVLAKHPEYTVMRCGQKTLYYVKDQVYIYGFDCTGLIQWVYREAGTPINGRVLSLTEQQFHDEHHLYCSGHDRPMPQDWAETARTLLPGDLFIVRHPGTHVMMYIGTLRQYGFTAEEFPALADWLDLPLVIQSGTNPYFGERFQRFLDTTPNNKYYGAQTTDGGVCVALVGVPKEMAERHAVVQKQEQWWFDVDGGKTALTVFDLDSVDSYCWYRP